MTIPAETSDQETSRLADELFRAHLLSIHRRADQLFAWLLAIQYLGVIAVALLVSPRTWIGVHSQIHIHVWAAFILGGIISSLPILLVRMRPGEVFTRQVVAVAQMLMSALLIHVTGGRIETHFHVFGSLAILA